MQSEDFPRICLFEKRFLFFQGFGAGAVFAVTSGTKWLADTNQNQTNLSNVKSNLVLILTAVMMPMLGGTALAGEKKVVTNNRHQVTAIVNTVASVPAEATQKKLIWNNRGQLIAVIPAASR